MSQCNNFSTVTVDGSTERWLQTTRDNAQAAAPHADLPVKRLEAFLADTAPNSSSSTTSSTTSSTRTQEAVIATAKQRMSVKLAAFEHAFNNRINGSHT